MRGGVRREVNTREDSEYFLSIIDDFDRAIEINPHFPDNYYHRGSVYSIIGYTENLEKAVLDFTKVLEIDPDYPHALTARANTNYILKNYDSAIKDFSKIIRHYSDDGQYFDRRPYYRRAEVYKDMGNYLAAINDFGMHIYLHPNNLFSYHERAKLYEKVENYPAAIEDYTKMISLAPSPPYYSLNGCYSMRASVKEKIGDYVSAKSDRDKATEIIKNRK